MSLSAHLCSWTYVQHFATLAQGLSVWVSMSNQPKHPIQVVARRTGLSADVIRVWERRYQAVSPQRSATSRRLYSDAEVERLLLLRRASQAGRRIGDVAQLSPEALRALVLEDQIAAGPGTEAAAPTSAREHLRACRQALDDMDPVAMDDALARAAVAFGIPVLLDDVVTPFLHDIGECWRAGTLRIGQEHFASAHVRTFLGHLRGISHMGTQGPVIVFTTPSGQGHELGALMAAVIAETEGWSALHLGPSTPAADIAAAVTRSGARAVGLSIIYPSDDPRMGEELRWLRRALPSQLPVLVGGAAVPAYRSIIEEIGARELPRLDSLRHALEALRAPAGEPS